MKDRRGSFWKKPKNGYCSNGRRWKEKLYEYDISASQRISDRNKAVCTAF
jgi:hypothetical protein